MVGQYIFHRKKVPSKHESSLQNQGSSFFQHLQVSEGIKQFAITAISYLTFFCRRQKAGNASIDWHSNFGFCIPKYWGSRSVLHFRGRMFQSELLCCLKQSIISTLVVCLFVFPFIWNDHGFSQTIFPLSLQEWKAWPLNNDVFHRGVGLQYLQSWAEVQMLLLWWCFLWTSPGALCSGNCSASSADSQCHNKCGFITSTEYWENGRSIHVKERRVKILRNMKRVINFGSW